jgi:hypothetical protein
MDTLSARAVAAALSVARSLGLRCSDDPELLKDGANVLVHLKPAPVVARIATTTGLVRQPAQRWLERDLNIARFLVAENFPVVPPSAELPPGPHVCNALGNGLAISFWEFVPHERGYAASAGETAPMLRELHAALRKYPGELPLLGPCVEILHWIDQLAAWKAIAAEDATLLRTAHEQVLSRIDRMSLPEQPLHGDAHNRNLLKTAKGLLWTDFEDACRGPLAWDLACFASMAAEGQAPALASYGGAASLEELTPFLEAREMEAVVWTLILATRFADRRVRAEEMLARARSSYSG